MRRMGTLGEVAALVSFLASEKCGFVTGHVIHIDGGLSIGVLHGAM
jgi:NAD(P)-dependent dehydrogenase (short-subunit alcohol dehydrogenase family)